MITHKDMLAVAKIRKFVVDNINSMDFFKNRVECLLNTDGNHTECHKHPFAKKFIEDNNIKNLEELEGLNYGICGGLAAQQQILKFIDEESLLEDK